MKNKLLALSLLLGIGSNLTFCMKTQESLMSFEKRESTITCTVRSTALDAIQSYRATFSINPETSEIVPLQTEYRIPGLQEKNRATLFHNPNNPNYIPMNPEMLRAVDLYTQYGTNRHIAWMHNPEKTPASNLAEAQMTYAHILRASLPGDVTLKHFTRKKIVESKLGITSY